MFCFWNVFFEIQERIGEAGWVLRIFLTKFWWFEPILSEVFWEFFLQNFGDLSQFWWFEPILSEVLIVRKISRIFLTKFWWFEPILISQILRVLGTRRSWRKKSRWTPKLQKSKITKNLPKSTKISKLKIKFKLFNKIRGTLLPRNAGASTIPPTPLPKKYSFQTNLQILFEKVLNNFVFSNFFRRIVMATLVLATRMIPSRTSDFWFFQTFSQ